ncbi:MAG: carbon-nitrogen family hydrolase [Planctomycetota bacterium]|nr:carbon-nitrogen family hydrolase [Planctomycetota bacterium]
MRATSIQLEVRDEPRPAAVERALGLLEQARGSDLILLPELWPTGYFSFERYAAEAEPLDGPTVRLMSDWARRLRAWLYMGSFVERDGARLYNTAVLLDASGAVTARYRKMHLFGYGSEEQKLLSRGEEAVTARTPWGIAGLATCYDLRFPELFRVLADRGAELFLVGSAWPKARLDAWLLFTRVRAHENLAHLLSCNCAGVNAGRPYAGHSQIVDPWGHVLAVGGADEALVGAEIDPGLPARARGEFPALSDRVLKSTPTAKGGTSVPEAQTAAEPYVFDPRTLAPFTSGKPYEGQQTGLYPGARNEIPAAHRQAGERLAASIRPLDPDGNPDEADGRILALVAGHSNCHQYFTELGRRLWAKRRELHPRFQLLNCAVGGQQLPELHGDENGPVWKNGQRLTGQAGYAPAQVQALFLHTTYHGAKNKAQRPAGPFPQEMRDMRDKMLVVLQRCAAAYPNLKLCYLTCDGFRHYTGFEPHVWREAFGVKWLIESQLNGEAGTAFEGPERRIPWLQWGPYFWNNEWDESYFTDGVHPSPKARQIFVEKYWQFLNADPVSKAWLFKKP